MPNLYLNQPQLVNWIEDSGDYTRSLEHNLTPDSIVIDLGGYTGMWAEQIVRRYNCNVYLVEPIFESWKTLFEKFENNSKVRILNGAVGISNTTKTMYVSQDSTSANSQIGEPEIVECRTIDYMLQQWNIEEVDLLQINIEGDEYELLQYMLDNEIINKFKTIQVQFHLGIEDATEKRKDICKGLEKRGFKVKYSYPFVWEAWTKD